MVDVRSTARPLAVAATGLFGALFFASAALANDEELINACISSEAGNSEECACFADKLGSQINENERIFAIAILSGDESKLNPIRGTFTNEDAQAMQGKTMSAMFACMAG